MEGNPLQRTILAVLQSTPEDRASWESKNVLEELVLRAVEVALNDRRTGLAAMTMLMNRAFGVAQREETGVPAELHVKVFAGVSQAPQLSEQGDQPYGPEERDLAQQRADGRRGRALRPLAGPGTPGRN